MDCNPKLFIGSAQESLEVAKSLEHELINDARTELWNRVFRPGHYTLEELARKAAEVDFAAFILGQEDKTKSRERLTLSPRDNVVYEAGLFAGRLGVSKVFLLVDARGTKIPTDWKGLGYITYDPDAGTASDVVHQAAGQIRKALSEWKASEVASLEQRISGYWWQFVVNQKQGAVISLLSVSSPPRCFDWKVNGTSWNGNGESIAVYWSRAAALDTRDRRLFYYWEGKFPFDQTIPAFLGVGEIQFGGATGNDFAEADGWYSETPLNELDATVKKSTKYLRASEADVQTMEGKNRRALEKLIKKRVTEWKAVCR